MPSKCNSTSFIIITGNPQEGNGQRISQVRSQLAKRHHHQRHQDAQPAISQTSGDRNYHVLSEQTSRGLPSEIHFHVDSTQLFPSVKAYQRMQEFMYRYVNYSHHIHPCFSTIVHAAVTHLPLMSTKILNASAWDDISTIGEISDLTRQQLTITRNLLSTSFDNLEEGCGDSNIAAMIAVLLFDLVSEDESAFLTDKKGIEGIVSIRGGPENLGFEGHLGNSLLVYAVSIPWLYYVCDFMLILKSNSIELLQKVARIGIYYNGHPISKSMQSLLSYALDLRVFTFGRVSGDIAEARRSHYFLNFLGDVYQMVRLSRQWHLYPNDTSTFRQCSTHLADIYDFLVTTHQSVEVSSLQDTDPRLRAVLNASLLFAWSGFASDKADSVNIPLAIYELQALLRQTDIDGFWGPLPGALIWCLAIGARLSKPGPVRKWFIMQTTRVTCALAMEECDLVLWCLEEILAGLDTEEMSSSDVVL